MSTRADGSVDGSQPDSCKRCAMNLHVHGCQSSLESETLVPFLLHGSTTTHSPDYRIDLHFPIGPPH